MGLDEVAAALERTAAVLRRQPSAGRHDDAPATAAWRGGTRVSVTGPHGGIVETDMPPALGGGGAAATPGWLFRAGIASCAATMVAMTAAMEGIALAALDVRVDSRSDTRAVLGLADADGGEVPAAPDDFRLRVALRADGVDEATLRALVATALHRCPIVGALQLPRELEVEVGIR